MSESHTFHVRDELVVNGEIRTDTMSARSSSTPLQINSEVHVDTTGNGSNELEVNSVDVHIKGRELKVDVDDDGTSELRVQTTNVRTTVPIRADGGLTFDTGTNTMTQYASSTGTLTFTTSPGYAADPTMTYWATRVGDAVTLHLDDFEATPDAAVADVFQTDVGNLPATFNPIRTFKHFVRVRDNGAWSDGTLEISSGGRLTFYRNNTSDFTNQNINNNLIGDFAVGYVGGS